MIKRFVKIACLQSCVMLGSYLWLGTEASPRGVPSRQISRSGFKVREPNVYAPDLYADRIDFIATVIDLPGANKKRSYWELSYQLYFIPEEKYYEALRHAPQGGYNPTPQEFPGRILLAEGHKKRTRLSTSKERTIALTGVAFKEKVPDALRTKFARLMTSYSVKIFDAELSTTAYYSGIFLTDPFEDGSDDQKQAVARNTIYLNFGINPNGTLNRSQLPPKTKANIRR